MGRISYFHGLYAPTYYGPVGYRIVSNVEHNKIAAELDFKLKAGRYPEKTMLRFRHPEAKPLKSITDNGKAWENYGPDKETIDISILSGEIKIVASYE